MSKASSSFARRRPSNILNVVVGAVLIVPALDLPALAQAPTPDPAAWRPFSYADLRHPGPDARTYADIWQDAIATNNTAYEARGDRRYAGGNAPVTEAHFVIWSSRKSVVLSVLDTATGCTLKTVRPSANATVRMCPMRVAIYEGLLVRTLDAGLGCYLELAPPSPGGTLDPERAVAYAAYDPRTRTLSTGVVLDHEAVDGCSLKVPLAPG